MTRSRRGGWFRRTRGLGSLVCRAALLAAILAVQVEPARAQVPSTIPASARADETATVSELAEWAQDEAGLERARVAIMTRVVQASGAEGTLWAQLLTVIEQVDGPGASEAIRAVGLALDSKPLAGSRLIIEELGQAGPEGRASLLALAAHLAELGDEPRAAELRSQLLREYPEAPEAMEARLLLAGWLLGAGEGEEAGLRLLEELIVGSPQHPLAPEARRLFEEHRNRGPGASQDPA